MSVPESSYLTLSQVSVRTGRHPELLRQWCAAGRMPCDRVGGSWVMLERDLALIDGIASRRGRAKPPRRQVASGASRVIAAVFDAQSAAVRAADALRDRLALEPEQVGTGPLNVPAVPEVSLTVVAGRVPGGSVVQARRVLTAFGGRVVADIEEIRAVVPAPGDDDEAAANEESADLEPANEPASLPLAAS